jgi:hypothetical protein
MKLRYLAERLEEICQSTYATDSAQDIANWIVNKPKPYRVLYDRYYDVWVIAHANDQTHSDMAIDLFDSGYLYGIAKDLDGDIYRIRNDESNSRGDRYSSGWTDAEVYQDYGFDHYQLKGLIFIPYGMEYRDYEESGFYSYKKNISTGTIFTQRPTEFSSDGIFKSLYNKLAIMKELQPEKKEVESLDALWGKVMVLKDVNKMVTAFTDFAKARGYTQKQIDNFLSEVV